MTEAMLHIDLLPDLHMIIDETGMGMRPGQYGMYWCMRYRGGRLVTELCRGDISGLVGYGCWLP